MYCIKKERKAFLYIFFLCLALFSLLLNPVFAKTKGKGWNVLLVTIDTLRTDRLSCYSIEHVETPHIDSLASKGVLFTRAFAHTCTTLPSHTNILLGTSPLEHGVHENSNFLVQEKHLTLAEFLKDQGYVTGAFVGAYPLDSRFGLDQGFRVYDDEYGSQSARGDKYYVERRAHEVVDRSLSWLRKQSSPWFLWVHLFDPHTPYEPPQPYRDKFKQDLYSGEVAYVDSELGRLFSYLESKNLYKDTLIVLTGDHGESLGEHGEVTHGFFAYNSSLWIPLIICIPGIGSGEVTDYVAHTDIFPTLCEALSLKEPDFLSGTSLISSIKGKELKRGPIYFESLYPFYSRGWPPLRGFIEDKKKFIESPIPEFYDLEEDFNEKTNLALQIETDRHRKRLDEIMEKYSPKEEVNARQTPDKEIIRKLRSLGYFSGTSIQKKREYGPEDDVKKMLPLYNKSIFAKQVYLEGKTQQAIRMLQEVITERKDIDVAYSNLATLYKEEGDLNSGFLVLEEGMRQLPESHEIFSAYVNFLTEAGQSDQVISLFKETTIREMDYDPELWNFLGIAYTRKGEYAEAIEALDEAISIDSGFAMSYSNKGNAYLSIFFDSEDKQALQKALKNFKKAVEIDPEDAVAYNGMGVTYQHWGDIKKAIEAWEKSLSIDPDYGLPLYNLGYTHMKLGNYIVSLEYFVKYRDLFQYSLPLERRKKLNSWINDIKVRITEGKKK